LEQRDFLKVPTMKWKAKALIQFVLSKIPGGESINHGLQILLGRFTSSHVREDVLAHLPMIRRISQHLPPRDATVVEIGTGWGLLDPLLFSAFGAREIYTYDRVRHLRFAAPQKAAAQIYALRGSSGFADADQQRIQAMHAATNLRELLDVSNIHYKAPGDGSATGLPNSSVDLFFSHNTLEHVTPAALAALIAESRRILKSSGIGFHVIDPGDHCPGVPTVNFLRYSDATWNFWAGGDITYHNRLRAKEFLQAFEKQAAIFRDVKTESIPSEVALLKGGFRINARFAHFTPEELAVHKLEVVYSFSNVQFPPHPTHDAASSALA